MNKSSIRKLISGITAVVLCAIHLGIFIFIWYRFYRPNLMLAFFAKGNYVTFFLFVILFAIFNYVFGGLKMGYYRTLDSVVSRTLGLISTYFIMYFVVCLLSYHIVNISYMLIASLLGGLINILWTYFTNYLYYKLIPPRKILLIHGDSPFNEFYTKFSSRKEKYEIVMRTHYEPGESYLKSLIDKHEAVILHDIPARLRNHLVKYCFEHSVRVYITPKLSDILLRSATEMDLFDTPLLLMRNHGLSPLQRFIKRVFDIVLSLLCLVITAPLLLLIIIVMAVFEHSSIFYRQTRLTLNGREFRILKFRTMYPDAEKDTIRLMQKGDDRITPIGRILRFTHLDELPQLINILKGDMSFVGPRPERPEIAAVYSESIPEFSYRLKMKAGLTGYAQVYGKYNSTPYDKLKLDLIYIQNYSVLLDIKLILLTWKTLFIPDHVEGVDSSFLTALRREVAITKEEEPSASDNTTEDSSSATSMNPRT